MRYIVNKAKILRKRGSNAVWGAILQVSGSVQPPAVM
jgi:hypothetical protein